jgi:hypothetical protein
VAAGGPASVDSIRGGIDPGDGLSIDRRYSI